MDCGYTRLTVCFEEPFWVAVCEREDQGALEVCKITFGAEPRDCEVYGFLLSHWHTLAFSPPVAAAPRRPDRPNPKRMQRRAAEQMERAGVGTKAQRALQLQREQNKRERRERSRDRDRAEEERKFQIRQEKRKEKHRGH